MNKSFQKFILFYSAILGLFSIILLSFLIFRVVKLYRKGNSDNEKLGLYISKIVECTLGYSFLIVFGYNSRISEEIKNLCNKNYYRVPSDVLTDSFMKEYVKEVNLDETFN